MRYGGDGSSVVLCISSTCDCFPISATLYRGEHFRYTNNHSASVHDTYSTLEQLVHASLYGDHDLMRGGVVRAAGLYAL